MTGIFIPIILFGAQPFASNAKKVTLHVESTCKQSLSDWANMSE